MKRIGFIFARGGSKGVPRKNARDFCGRPLIAWAIEKGLACGMLEKMVVSTDDPAIADIARAHGAEVPFLRPAELATDGAPERLAWRHAVNFLRGRGESFDTFVSLPATAPLRTVENIRDAIRLYEQGGCDTVITCTDISCSPYFTMITESPEGYARLFGDAGRPVTRRQDAPPVYEITAVAYVTSPAHILAHELLDGRVRALHVDKVNAIDIDDAFDWEIAEYFMKKRLAERA